MFLYARQIFNLRRDYSSDRRKNSDFAIHSVAGKLAAETIYPVNSTQLNKPRRKLAHKRKEAQGP